MKDADYSLPCPLWPDYPQRCTVVLTIKQVCATFSLLGCTSIIFIIWLFKHYKSQVQRLKLYLTLSAGLAAIIYLANEAREENTVCQATAFLTQFIDWATLLWVCAISFNMVLIVHNKSLKQETWYHTICWGISLLLAVIPIAANKYGQAGLWCWISRENIGYRFGTWYVPVFILLLLMVVIYIYVFFSIKKRDGSFSGFSKSEENQQQSMLAKEVKPLIAFPLIYIVVSIPNLIYRIDDAVHPKELPSYPLCILNALFMPSVGGMNAIAFALYNDVHKMLTWNQMKFAFLAHFNSSASVIHNVDIDDTEPIQEVRVET